MKTEYKFANGNNLSIEYKNGEIRIDETNEKWITIKGRRVLVKDDVIQNGEYKGERYVPVKTDDDENSEKWITIKGKKVLVKDDVIQNGEYKGEKYTPRNDEDHWVTSHDEPHNHFMVNENGDITKGFGGQFKGNQPKEKVMSYDDKKDFEDWVNEKRPEREPFVNRLSRLAKGESITILNKKGQGKYQKFGRVTKGENGWKLENASEPQEENWLETYTDKNGKKKKFSVKTKPNPRDVRLYNGTGTDNDIADIILAKVSNRNILGKILIDSLYG